jgi:hypothetical protein
VFDPGTCYDVAVLGGGLCGFAAARELARRGHRVALIERRPVLGWEITWAFHTEDSFSIGGRTADWFASAMSQAAGSWEPGLVDPPIAEMVLDREAGALGIEVLLYAQPVAAAQRDGLVTRVLLGTKSGELCVRARAFVDATENALLWRLAGGEVVPAENSPARYALFVNNVPDPAVPGVRQLGELAGCREVLVRPSLWPGELVVSFEIEACDVRLARRKLPALLRALRDAEALPASALVTSVAAEPYPLTAPRPKGAPCVSPPGVANLFGAGPWVMPEGLGDRSPSLGGRLYFGEWAADAVLIHLGQLPEPIQTGGDAVPHSRVAPPEHEADVVVCGGGTGGAFAAIAAAREGAKTILLEQGTCLGGIGTGGGIHSYYHGVPGGLQDEADERLRELTPLFGPPEKVSGFHPEAKKVVLELMAAGAGVEIIYNTAITGAHAETVPSRLPARPDAQPSRRLRAVVAAGPDGNATYRAKAFVDATGDGDLAAMAGAQFTFGRATDGLPHAYSLAAGRLSGDGKLLITNFDAGYCDPTDVVDLTRARRRALGHYWRERFDAKNRLVYVAPILGLRNSRQVVGDYRITLADEIAGRQFPDVIAYAYSHFDNHGFDYENESDEAMLWVWLLGNWSRRIGCEVPYRALLPLGIEGLLMACRALSMTHDAHNQLRMQRDLQRIGEAAGVAAAMAAARGITTRELPVADLQAILLSTGALGQVPSSRATVGLPDRASSPQDTAGQASRGTTTGGDVALATAGPDTAGTSPAGPASRGTAAGGELTLAEALHDTSWMPPLVPALPFAERVAQLGTEKSQEATWDLIRRGGEALPLLLDAARAEKPATRFWASVALAMMGRAEAAPELRACLADRRAEAPEGRKTVPLWKSAVVLLGRIGDHNAVPLLCQALEDRSADLDALIAVLRALGRIGDPAAIPAIEAFLTRPDLPAQREFQVSISGVSPVREDARWQLDLAAAETLARLGSPRPDLAEPHTRDERAYVRNHARRVASLSAGRAAE